MSVHLMVAPPMPAIQPTKKVTTKGKTVSHQATQPWAHKVMGVISPLPDVTEVPGPNPPVAGLSMVMLHLFKELALSGGEEVGPGVGESSGELG